MRTLLQVLSFGVACLAAGPVRAAHPYRKAGASGIKPHAFHRGKVVRRKLADEGERSSTLQLPLTVSQAETATTGTQTVRHFPMTKFQN